MADLLRFVVRTPGAVVSDLPVRSARIPTESGVIGLRPRMEGLITTVEPGLVVFTGVDAVHFAGTVGGLLDARSDRATLLTPLAVVGTEAEVLASLARMREFPPEEIAARRRLAGLESRLRTELKPLTSASSAGRRVGGTRDA